MGNNPMVGALVAVAVAISQALFFHKIEYPGSKTRGDYYLRDFVPFLLE